MSKLPKANPDEKEKISIRKYWLFMPKRLFLAKLEEIPITLEMPTTCSGISIKFFLLNQVAASGAGVDDVSSAPSLASASAS